MSRRVQQLEYRMADTRVAGRRVQSSEEAQKAAYKLESLIAESNRAKLVGSPRVSLFRWGDSGEVCNLSVTVEIDTELMAIEHAEEIIHHVFRELRQGTYR